MKTSKRIPRLLCLVLLGVSVALNTLPVFAETLDQVEAEAYDSTKQIMETDNAKDEVQSNSVIARNGDWLCYKSINLGTWLNFVNLQLASANGGGRIELRLDSLTGKLFGEYTVEGPGGGQNWVTVEIGSSDYRVSGTHDIYLLFSGSEPQAVCHLNWWEIEGSREQEY